ncbi:YceI family protein [Deinococcus sp. HMF7604]|uniref:YceI family protein n=1 Tax=Deinococcus betulae TaxID=2873312 RepID=UPI001CCF5799|nr:YceI family protein [Deinococcus betulae]MBZ9751120.1 YceI family protein [Deinococcus betulae]
MKRLWAAGTAAVLMAGEAQGAAYRAADGQASFTHTVRLIPVRGNIAGVTASVELDPANLAATTGSVKVPVSGLKTGIGLRDTHAKGENALNAAKFPNATFALEKLTGGKLAEGQTLSTTATGKLTVKGTTKTISVPVKATLQGGKVNVSTQFKFNPYDYDVRYPGSSDSVTVDVSFTLTKG